MGFKIDSLGKFGQLMRDIFHASNATIKRILNTS